MQFKLFKNINNKTIKENWWDEWDKDNLKNFLRTEKEGINSPSRIKIREILNNYENCTLLDVGCGAAVELEGYIKNSIKVQYTGLDRSNKMLELAKELFPDNKFVYGDINNIEFEDNSFDIVLVRHLLEHLGDYKQAIKECYRVSRKLLIINFFIKLNDSAKDQITSRNDPVYNNSYSRQLFESFLVNELKCKNYENIIGLGRSNYSENEIYIIHKAAGDK